MPIATGQVTIAAAPADVYRLVGDPPVMAGFANELYRARWLDGVTEAAVGTRFRGTAGTGGGPSAGSPTSNRGGVSPTR